MSTASAATRSSLGMYSLTSFWMVAVWCCVLCVFRGAAKNYLESNFAFPLQVDNNCKNGHILCAFVNNNESHQSTIEQVNKLYGFNICYSQTKLLVNVSKKWACNFLRDSKRFVDFCNEPFICQATTLPATQSFQSTPNSSKTVSSLSVASSPKHKKIIKKVLCYPG